MEALADIGSELGEAFMNNIRSTKGDRYKARQEPAEAGAEGQGAEALHPAKIEFRRTVHTLEDRPQPAIGFQQGIAENKFAQAPAVGQLEMVARQCVPEITERQEASLGGLIQQFFEQFVSGQKGMIDRPP